MAVLQALRLRDHFQAKDLFLLAGILALGVLVRTDTIVPAAVVSGFTLLTARPRHRGIVAVTLAGVVIGTLAAHTGFRALYYGYPLPNTYYLKVHEIGLEPRVLRGAGWLAFHSAAHLCVPLILAAGYLVARRRNVHPGAYLLAAIFLGQAAYSVYVGGDVWEWMGYANRYLTPSVPGLLVLCAFGADAFRRAGWQVRGTVVLGFAVLSLVGIGLGAVQLLMVEGPSAETPRLATAATTGLLFATGAFALGFVTLRAMRRERYRTHGQPWQRVPVALALVCLLVISVNGSPFASWLIRNGYKVHADTAMTRYGLALREVTTADATIAVVWAGAVPYFAHRPVVDLLGKSDYMVASGPPRGTFIPGHNKWNYAYSIGELRPDVVAQSWELSEQDLTDLRAWGYVRVAPGVFVRADSSRVSRVDLEAMLATLPSVMHATDWPWHADPAAG